MPRRLQCARAGTPPHEPPFLFLVVAFVPIGRAGDIGGRLFTQGFADQLGEVVDGLPREPLFHGWAADRPTSYVTQDAIVAGRVGDDARQIWRIRATWDGSIAVHFQVYPRAEHEGRVFADALFSEAIQPASEAAATLVEALGGYGRAHVVLALKSSGFELLHGDLARPVLDTLRFPIQRWTADDGRLDNRLTETMKRELLRACGIPAYESQ